MHSQLSSPGFMSTNSDASGKRGKNQFILYRKSLISFSLSLEQL